MPGFTAWIVFSCFSVVAAALNTVLNVDEINSIHYAVDILSKPVLKDQVWDGDVMTVVNKHGQEYICSLPSVTPLGSDLKHDEDILDQLVDISVLLRPMETAPCLIKTVDWWTYEFCYGSVINQYHLEDYKASGPIIILGKYESEYNWKNSSETKNHLQRFHSQFYVNGTKCDLTGEPRRTEVRFHCEDGVGDYIQRVDEPESCRYVVTVVTTRVCHHPYLRLQSVRTPHAITCAPALTQEQYHKYLTYQNKKMKEEQNLKEKWLKQNAEVLRGAVSEENHSILHPITTDPEEDEDEEELKMNIIFFRLAPVKKPKSQQSAEDKEDVMEVEMKITLEESDTHLKVKDMKLTGTDEVAKSREDTEDVNDEDTGSTKEQEEKRRKEKNIDVGSEEEESFITDLQAQELVQFLDVSEDYTDTTDITSTDEESVNIEQEAQKEMETLEEFLDSQLKEMEDSASQESGSSAPEKSTQGTDSQDSVEGISQASKDPEEDTNSKESKKNADKGASSTRELRIMENRMPDELQTTKFEQTIKNRLKELGLKKNGIKFEMRIYTLSSLEDEDTNNPLLSQEETEAAQNIIVNLYSENAEVLQERENHRKLEKNYSFKWDDSQLAEDEDE